MIVASMFFLESSKLENEAILKKVYPKTVNFEYRKNGFNLLVNGISQRIYPREFLDNYVIENEMNSLDFYSRNLLRKVIENKEILSATITYEACLKNIRGYIVEVLMNLSDDSLAQYNFETSKKAFIYFGENA